MMCVISKILSLERPALDSDVDFGKSAPLPISILRRIPLVQNMMEECLPPLDSKRIWEAEQWVPAQVTKKGADGNDAWVKEHGRWISLHKHTTTSHCVADKLRNC